MLCILGLTSQANAIVIDIKEDKKIGFTRDINTLKASLVLPVTTKVMSLPLPVKKLKIRAQKGAAAGFVEPLALTIPKDQEKISSYARELARRGKDEEFENLLIEKLKKIGPTTGSSVRVDITPEDFKLIDARKLSHEFAKPHYQVRIDSESLAAQPKLKSQLLDQLSSFLTSQAKEALALKIASGDTVTVDEDMLPSFAKKMVKKYLTIKGPNCFHAALAFQSSKLTRSPFINVKEEEGYHRSMINYDELWRVLNKSFYEVDVSKYPLKYGDMIVFFNVPGDFDENQHNVNFRWIRHTATYLFGPYTFSKGSKSPDTPYTVKTLEEEWKTWMEYTSSLGVKVYRRNQKTLQKKLPEDLNDWIY
jgi:hypothetical protein